MFEKNNIRLPIAIDPSVAVSSDLKRYPMNIPIKINNVDAIRSTTKEFVKVTRISSFKKYSAAKNIITNWNITNNRLVIYVPSINVKSLTGVIKFLKYAGDTFSLVTIVEANKILINIKTNTIKVGNKKLRWVFLEVIGCIDAVIGLTIDSALVILIESMSAFILLRCLLVWIHLQVYSLLLKHVIEIHLLHH